jgi:hypothetical protein
MPKTTSGRSGDSALVKVPGLPGVYPQPMNNRTRGRRCGRRRASTEDPQSDHFVRAAAGGSEEDSSLQVLRGRCNPIKGAGMEASA